MPLTARDANIYKTPAPKSKHIPQNYQNDSGFISPPTIVEYEAGSPCHGYNLRPPQPLRWSSTPLPLPVSGLSLSTPMLMKSVSTPASTLRLPNEDEKPKIDNILGFRQRLEGLDNTEYDSGFDSLLADQSWLPTSEKKPDNGSLGAVPKRRSPRRSPRQPPRKPDSELSSRQPSESSSLPSISQIRLSKEGRERFDIVRGLFEMNTWHTLGHLFKYLSAAELGKVAQVSQFWNLALKENSEHNNRRLQYIERVKKDKENFGVDAERKRISPRRVLREFSNIKNQISPNSTKRERDNRSSSSSLVSPSKVRHMLFVDQAKNLTPGERLVQCPLCTSPSRVSSTKAECSSPRCLFVFCPDCQCRDHPGQPCRTSLRQSVARSSKSGGVLSKKSKTRLRKL